MQVPAYRPMMTAPLQRQTTQATPQVVAVAQPASQPMTVSGVDMAALQQSWQTLKQLFGALFGKLGAAIASFTKPQAP